MAVLRKKIICLYRKQERAFTLVELMSVLTILIILLSLVFPIAEHVKKTSLKLQTKLQFCSYISAIEDFKANFGSYPRFLTCTRPCNLNNCFQNFCNCLARYAKNESYNFHTFTAQEINNSQLVDSFGNSEIFVLIKKPSERTIPRSSFPECVRDFVPPEGLIDTIAICSAPTVKSTPIVCSWN